MEHPKLKASEIEIIHRVRSGLFRELEALSADRWAQVTLAVVVELAGDIVDMVPGDTEPPPEVCPNEFECLGKRVYCLRPRGHQGGCAGEIR